MVEFNLPLIAAIIGIIASIWKFANSISKFATSVDDLKKSMQDSQTDRKELRRILNDHDKELAVIKTQYSDIKSGLGEIKEEIKKS